MAFINMQGSMKVVYKNGDKYDGEMQDGKRHGKGTATFADGRNYTGDWEKDLPHGRGLMTHDNGETYEGQFKDGEMNGTGTYKYSNGNVMYEGQWKDDKMHGKGTYHHASGDVYDGEFVIVNDAAHGRGLVTYVNGETYKGDFINDNKHGRGTYHYANGDVYDGGFVNGKSHGYGTEKYANGDVYKGTWKDDEKHGKGTFKCQRDGIIYRQSHNYGKLVSSKRPPSKRPPTIINDSCSKRPRCDKTVKVKAEIEVNQPINAEVGGNHAMKCETDDEEFPEPENEGTLQDSSGHAKQSIFEFKAEIESLKKDLAKEKALREDMQTQIKALQRNCTDD